jgi:superoxide dismutase, Fe-Mn family
MPTMSVQFSAFFGELMLIFLLKALEPYISEEIMKLHHTKHHQTYVNGLNAAEEAYAKADSTAQKIALQPALKFNGGGL